MAKTESTLKNMVLTLLVITGVAGTSLGFMFELTKGPIEAAKKAKQEAAIKMVMPEFDSLEKDTTIANTNFFRASSNGELVGIAIEAVSPKGFSGNIKIMVGFKPDGTIINYQVLEHKETPGLGTKMADWFKTDKGKQSILGKHPETNKLTVSKDGGEVDAITAATISSRAFLDAVRIAYETYNDNKSNEPVAANTSAEEGGTE
ncbi:RnfABCDGE type electron transport complex subunit G [Carboxylicivirga sp. N1Y90]|uniref:RnfABCDGE type electron transport complex subunit G n=1 Tax=Carboxylicivirga fragile TaxID=3417571 RepID=UPI003D33C052|nr:RnfABCDGE type electron transport complex subunit G [Marinilabiliaceae bacterium N1Y90]